MQITVLDKQLGGHSELKVRLELPSESLSLAELIRIKVKTTVSVQNDLILIEQDRLRKQIEALKQSLKDLTQHTENTFQAHKQQEQTMLNETEQRLNNPKTAARWQTAEQNRITASLTTEDSRLTAKLEKASEELEALSLLEPEAATEQAYQAFQDDSFLVMIDNKQVETLADIINIREKTQISFLKLIPLIGG